MITDRELATFVCNDVFTWLGKFPEEPYKLRLMTNSILGKHRPRKETLQGGQRLIEIYILDSVTDPSGFF